MKDSRLPPIQSKILSVLVKTDDYMTTAQVASEAGISWNTALFYLKLFQEKGWVDKEGDKVVYWKAILQD